MSTHLPLFIPYPPTLYPCVILCLFFRAEMSSLSYALYCDRRVLPGTSSYRFYQ